MKKFRFPVLLLSFIIFFSFSLGAQEGAGDTAPNTPGAVATGVESVIGEPYVRGENADAQATESGLGCVGVECIGQGKSVAEETSALCFKTLPEQCQKIKNPKLTVCYPIIDRSTGSCLKSEPMVKSCVQTGLASTLKGCFRGILSGLKDSVYVIGKMAVGSYGLLTNEVVRDEAGMAISNLVAEISSSGGDEFLKELILSGLMETLDEFAKCLNFEGRVEYFCEAGVQIGAGYAGYRAAKWGVKGTAYRIGNVANKVKLTPRQKVLQKRLLKEKLIIERGAIQANDLTPYQMSQLSRPQIKRIDFTDFSDDLAAFMSVRQLRAIPVKELKKMDTIQIAGTLGRLSDKQFKAVISKPDINDLPSFVIEQNIKRIPASRIGMLNHINGVYPRKLSVAQIRALSDAQMRKWDHINFTRWKPMKRRAFKSRQTKYRQNTAEPFVDKKAKANERRRTRDEAASPGFFLDAGGDDIF